MYSFFYYFSTYSWRINRFKSDDCILKLYISTTPSSSLPFWYCSLANIDINRRRRLMFVLSCFSTFTNVQIPIGKHWQTLMMPSNVGLVFWTIVDLRFVMVRIATLHNQFVSFFLGLMVLHLKKRKWEISFLFLCFVWIEILLLVGSFINSSPQFYFYRQVPKETFYQSKLI